MFRFLELGEVGELHAASLSAYGGTAGVRNSGLAESAIAPAVNTAIFRWLFG